MFVLLSPTYLDRLWCRYEYVTFLALHPVDEVHVEFRTFLDDGADRWRVLGLMGQIRDSSTETAGCKVEADRKILHALIQDNFKSSAVLDDLIRFSLIALLCRSLLLSELPHELRGADSIYEQLLQLAGALKFERLRSELEGLRDDVRLQELIDTGDDPLPHIKDAFQERVAEPLLLPTQCGAIKDSSPLWALRGETQRVAFQAKQPCVPGQPMAELLGNALPRCDREPSPHPRHSGGEALRGGGSNLQ